MIEDKSPWSKIKRHLETEKEREYYDKLAKKQASREKSMDEQNESRSNYMQRAEDPYGYEYGFPELGSSADLFAKAHEEAIRRGPITPSKGNRGGAKVIRPSREMYPAKEED